MIRRPPRSTLFPYTRSSDLYLGDEHLCPATCRSLPAHKRQHQCRHGSRGQQDPTCAYAAWVHPDRCRSEDRKSTRLNSSHLVISYAVFCLKKKKTQPNDETR